MVCSTTIEEHADLAFHVGLYSLSGRSSHRKIVLSLETTRLGVILVVSLWNVTAAEVPIKFQSDWKSLNPNFAATRRQEILR